MFVRVFIAVAILESAALGGALTWKKSPINGHWYSLSPAGISWNAARQLALGAGGELATVRSLAESQWLSATYATAPILGTGFNDIAEEGVWTWISGEATVFTHWAPNQPDDYLGSQDICFIMNTWGGTWDDGHQVDVGSPESAFLLEIADSMDCDADGIPDTFESSLGTSPTQFFGLGCPGLGGVIPRLSLSGCPVPSSAVTLEVSQASPNSYGVLVFGLLQTSLPINPACALLVSPLLSTTIPLHMAGQSEVPGSGSISVPAIIPASVPAAVLRMQVFIAAPVPGSVSATNGLALTF